MNMRSAKSTSRNQGFTLFELFIVLLIAAVLVAWGFPSLTQSIRNNQVASQNMSLMAMLNLTKSEAVRRNTLVNMEVTSTGSSWEAIVEDPTNEAEVEGCAIGQLRCSTNSGVSIVMCDEDGDCSNSFDLAFNNRGYLNPGDPVVWEAKTIFLQHENCSGQNQRRRVDVLPTGQISACSLACNSTAACP